MKICINDGKNSQAGKNATILAAAHAAESHLIHDVFNVGWHDEIRSSTWLYIHLVIHGQCLWKLQIQWTLVSAVEQGRGAIDVV